jgi:hypothetical protein
VRKVVAETVEAELAQRQNAVDANSVGVRLPMAADA